GLWCPGRELIRSSATFDMDPTKLLISVKDLSITGNQAEVWLRENANIEVELSDLYNILCILTIGDTGKEVTLLINALKRMAATCAPDGSERPPFVALPEIPALALTPRDAFYAQTEAIPLDEAEGLISAECIMVYPPGIPIIIPGEIVTRDNIDYIRMNMEAGLPVQGPEDDTMQNLLVIKERMPIIS